MAIHKKREEIIEFTKERVEEIHDYNPDKLDDLSELHHEIFNTDYYIIGRYQCEQWLGTDVFHCIETIKDYEEFHFGESHTDLSCPESVVNMYVYIIGEEVLPEVVNGTLEEDEQLELMEEQ